jgi:hypothetical protein
MSRLAQSQRITADRVHGSKTEFARCGARREPARKAVDQRMVNSFFCHSTLGIGAI